MKFLFMIALSFTMAGCSFFKSSSCEVAKTATDLVAAQITTQLACKNFDAVKSDIEKKLTEYKICEKQEKPAATTMATKLSVGSALCAPVIESLTAGLVGQIPEAWACTGGQVTDDLKLKLLEACSKAL